MCSAIQKKGVDVLIATSDDADGPGHMDVELERPAEYRGVPTIFFRWRLSQRFQYCPSLARWVNAHVREYDVVHIHAVFSQPCIAAARACKRHGVPYVVRPLGSLDPWSLRQRRLRKRVLWRLGVRAMLKNASAIHYTSEREKLVAEGPLGLSRGVVVPLGVDSQALGEVKGGHGNTAALPFQQGGPYVLTLSRLDPKKGLDLFIEVFLRAVALPGLERWRLVIAGKGEGTYIEALKRRIKDLGGQERVTFVGWVDGADKVAALAGASLLAQPSQQENFGLSVIEALARGVPVLVSDQMDIAGDIAEARAGWVTPLEPQAMLRILEEALRSESARAARGSAGRALVRSRFTWEAVADQLLRLYESIAQRPLAAQG